MPKQHESTPFDALSPHEWEIATQKLQVQNLREWLRKEPPGWYHNWLVVELSTQEQILADLMASQSYSKPVRETVPAI